MRPVILDECNNNMFCLHDFPLSLSPTNNLSLIILSLLRSMSWDNAAVNFISTAFMSVCGDFCLFIALAYLEVFSLFVITCSLDVGLSHGWIQYLIKPEHHSSAFIACAVQSTHPPVVVPFTDAFKL